MKEYTVLGKKSRIYFLAFFYPLDRVVYRYYNSAMKYNRLVVYVPKELVNRLKLKLVKENKSMSAWIRERIMMEVFK